MLEKNLFFLSLFPFTEEKSIMGAAESPGCFLCVLCASFSQQMALGISEVSYNLALEERLPWDPDLQGSGS